MARIIEAFAQFFDGSGNPLVDGFLKFNETGTNNTDKNTFADISETIGNDNPLQLDAEGRCPNVFGSGSYNVVSFKDSIITPGTPGEQIQQFDPVGGDLEGSEFSDWNASTTYAIKDKVRASDGEDYRSLTNNNQNNNPTSSPTNWEQLRLGRVWNSNVTYSLGDSVYGSDGFLYTSRTGSNLNNDPTSDSVNWGTGINDDRIVGAPRGYIDGLITSIGTDTAHDIDLSVGEGSDSTNAVTIELTSVITKQIDANWAEGTNQGGFPSGLTLGVTTWYHFFTIAKPDGTTDAGWDTSTTAVNLLADATGYTLFKLVFSHFSDGSSNLTPFTQRGDECLWDVPVSDVNSSNPGTAAVLVAMTTPLALRTMALATYSIIDVTPAAQTLCIVTSPDQADTAPVTTLSDMRILVTATGGGAPSVNKAIRTNLSSQIRFRLDNSDAGVSFRSTLFGFIHPRGKE